jgi:hypothetical protein
LSCVSKVRNYRVVSCWSSFGINHNKSSIKLSALGNVEHTIKRVILLLILHKKAEIHYIRDNVTLQRNSIVWAICFRGVHFENTQIFLASGSRCDILFCCFVPFYNLAFIIFWLNAFFVYKYLGCS